MQNEMQHLEQTLLAYLQDLHPERVDSREAAADKAETQAADKPSAARKPCKPFTPNPTRGYEVQRGKVKIYLDRRAASRVITLSIEDLRELVRAVEKAE